MDQETENRIYTILSTRYNPWWTSGKAPKTAPFHRMDFYHILKLIDDDKIVVVTGPRQTGKSTIVRQLIEEKLASGTPPKHILFAQLDDKELNDLSRNPLVDIVNIYEKNVLEENLADTQARIFMFFDEIQNADGWAQYAKGCYDLNRRVRMAVTGSASQKIQQDAKKILAGRYWLQSVFPLKFLDACLFREELQKTEGAFPASMLKREALELRNAFEETLKTNDPGPMHQAARGLWQKTIRGHIRFQSEARTYLQKGGYPEIVASDDIQRCQTLLETYADDALVNDIAPWFRLRDFATAKTLRFLLAAASGEKLNFSEIQKHIPGSNFNTLDRYTSAFESVFILSRLPSYSKGRFGSTKHPKIYFLDAGLQNALLRRLGTPFAPDEEGHLAEIVAHDHFRRLLYKLNSGALPSFGYGFTKEKKEIDFIADLKKFRTELPVEVKFRKTIRKDDLQGIYEFQEAEKPVISLVVTSETLKLEDRILFIPLWMFLLMA
ncbi:MAG: ATP-binding protein [Candidatus Micrarchaeota archaeon]